MTFKKIYSDQVFALYRKTDSILEKILATTTTPL